MGEVRLEPYNPLWKEKFVIEKENLLKMMGGIVITIEHIGSTSIEGLSAKPIIDIAVAVNRLTDFEKVKQEFLNNSEYSIKEDSPSDEILVRKGPEESRTHFIHIMELESSRYKNTILFRDYLIAHSKERLEYEELKTELAGKYSDNRVMYTSLKNDFITDILNKASAEKKK